MTARVRYSSTNAHLELGRDCLCSPASTIEDQETKLKLSFSFESYEWGQDGAAAQGTFKMGSFVILLLQ